MAAMAFDARDAAAESSADTSGVFKSIAELRAERQAQNSVDEAVGGNSRRGSHDSASSSVTAKSAPNPLRDAVGSTARARGLETSAAYQFGPPVGGPDLAARYADMAAMAFEAADTEASKVFRRGNTPDFILEDDDTVDRLRTLDNRIIDTDAHSRVGGQWASAVSTGVIASSSGTAFSQRTAGYSGLAQQSLEGGGGVQLPLQLRQGGPSTALAAGRGDEEEELGARQADNSRLSPLLKANRVPV